MVFFKRDTMKKFILVAAVLIIGWCVAMTVDIPKTSDAFNIPSTSAIKRRVYVSSVLSYPAMAFSGTTNRANAISMTGGIATRHMEGEFSSIIEVSHITTAGGGAGGVNLWYQVSPNNVDWYTPDTSSIDTQAVTGTSVNSFSVIATPYIKFRTNVTGTTRYRVFIQGR